MTPKTCCFRSNSRQVALSLYKQYNKQTISKKWTILSSFSLPFSFSFFGGGFNSKEQEYHNSTIVLDWTGLDQTRPVHTSLEFNIRHFLCELLECACSVAHSHNHLAQILARSHDVHSLKYLCTPPSDNITEISEPKTASLAANTGVRTPIKKVPVFVQQEDFTDYADDL